MRYVTACLLVVATLLAARVVATPLGRFEFTTAQQAAAILSSRDAFVLAMNPIDRAVRMRTIAPPSEPEFIDFLSRQARPWQPAEISRLTPLLVDVERQLSRLAVALPIRIGLVRTTDRVEDGAPHTRGETIVLPEAALAVPPETIRHVLFHELFHLLTRTNLSLRDKLYSLIGFAPCGNLELSTDLAQRLITNPDAPRSIHFIRVSIAGKSLAAVPLLVAKGDASPQQRLFDAFELRFLEVHPQVERCVPAVGESPPKLHQLAQIDGFFQQIGRNTNYVIHPEEVLADNFAILMTGSPNVRDPEIPEKLQRALMR